MLLHHYTDWVQPGATIIDEKDFNGDNKTLNITLECFRTVMLAADNLCTVLQFWKELYTLIFRLG